MLLGRYVTQYTADSVEQRPRRNGEFAVATYQLESDMRPGDVTLMRWEPDGMNEIRKWETGGVLDLLWTPDGETLLAAKASGEVHVIMEDTDHTIEISPGNILLAVESDGVTTAVSDNKGSVFLLDPSLSSVSATYPGLHGSRGWGWEVWGIGVSGDSLYSGGDDCVFKATDTRSGVSIFSNTKEHTMGVCCISPEPEHHVLTGCYDEMVRRWDTRNPRAPLQTSPVGGGVWRLKQSRDHILVAGMHSGFHVLHRDTLDIVTSYTDHGSLAYGASWLGDEGLVATCSFYDNLVTVWNAVPEGKKGDTVQSEEGS
eukprot:sb/3467013/